MLFAVWKKFEKKKSFQVNTRNQTWPSPWTTKNICIFSKFKIKNDNSPDVCDENRAVNVSTQCKYPSLLVPNCGLFIEVVQYFIFNGASNAAAARHGRADHKSNSSNVFTIKNRSERREEMEVGDLSSLTSYFKFNYISLWPVVVSCFFTNTNNDSGRVFHLLF